MGHLFFDTDDIPCDSDEIPFGRDFIAKIGTINGSKFQQYILYPVLKQGE